MNHFVFAAVLLALGRQTSALYFANSEAGCPPLACPAGCEPDVGSGELGSGDCATQCLCTESTTASAQELCQPLSCPVGCEPDEGSGELGSADCPTQCLCTGSSPSSTTPSTTITFGFGCDAPPYCPSGCYIVDDSNQSPCPICQCPTDTTTGTSTTTGPTSSTSYAVTTSCIMPPCPNLCLLENVYGENICPSNCPPCTPTQETTATGPPTTSVLCPPATTCAGGCSWTYDINGCINGCQSCITDTTTSGPTETPTSTPETPTTSTPFPTVIDCLYTVFMDCPSPCSLNYDNGGPCPDCQCISVTTIGSTTTVFCPPAEYFDQCIADGCYIMDPYPPEYPCGGCYCPPTTVTPTSTTTTATSSIATTTSSTDGPTSTTTPCVIQCPDGCYFPFEIPPGHCPTGLPCLCTTTATSTIISSTTTSTTTTTSPTTTQSTKSLTTTTRSTKATTSACSVPTCPDGCRLVHDNNGNDGCPRCKCNTCKNMNCNEGKKCQMIDNEAQCVGIKGKSKREIKLRDLLLLSRIHPEKK